MTILQPVARFVEQQDRICPAGDTVVLALATHASLKLNTVC